jgi:hypothetical protein
MRGTAFYLRKCVLLDKQETYFMEPEVPLLCSREDITGPYIESDQSSPLAYSCSESHLSTALLFTPVSSKRFILLRFSL